ncbi:LacI family DNA-binding transcriptional regulator [Enterococcus sp. LJL99]
MITIRQIAQEAGVSKSTVSRYLNNGYVSKKSEEKIKQIINKHNFIPNEFARNLKAEKSKFIGVVVPRFDSPSVMSVLDGIDKVARKNGYQLLIQNTELDIAREIESLFSLVQNKVAGIISFATEITEDLLQAVDKINCPIIIFGQSHPDVYSVNQNNFQAGQLLASRLISYGHQNVIYVGVPEVDVSIGIDRKKGVVETFEKHGISVKTVEATFRINDNYHLGLELFDQPQATLYIAATDNMAMGLYKAAHEKGLQVGSDISIAGFGGYTFGEFVIPTLTTVDLHHYHAGEVAAIQLIKRINGESIQKEHFIEVSFCSRESVR